MYSEIKIKITEGFHCIYYVITLEQTRFHYEDLHKIKELSDLLGDNLRQVYIILNNFDKLSEKDKKTKK